MSENDEPKIIVDEDWKAQVEKEKEALKEQAEAPSADEAMDERSMQIPEASFPVLLSTLATQAISSMGLLPDPHGQMPPTNLEMAKHFIDTIAVLEEKTKGNLTDDEVAMVKENLHQLRMAFVAAGQAATSTPPVAAPSPSSIELP